MNLLLVLLLPCLALCLNIASDLFRPFHDLNLFSRPAIGPPSTLMHPKKPRPIHGRFLHITDIHPDPYYIPGTNTDETCHRGKDEDGVVGQYGTPNSPCDAPSSLVDATFDWIEQNLKDKIDFVIWTGDNVRHDRDNRFPRTEIHILDMNERMVKKMEDVFSCDDPFHPLEIPIVPSLGNNDVYPHNLFAQGPTLQTREFYRIWRKMVPEEQFHVFDRGTSYMVEVIPGKLAVLAINTLYWFQSNPIVDGCNKRKDPGHQQFRWLGIVLSELRARNMKVWFSGHVPPNANNWEPSCLDRYSAWIHEYRDIIVGGLYGHMNLDHFLFLDSQAVTPEVSISSEDINWDDESPISVAGKVEYLQDLRESYAAIANDPSDHLHTRYSVAHVNPSVIPTYLPGLRVWDYNITGLEAELPSVYSNGEPLRSWADVFIEIDEEMARLRADDSPEDEEDSELLETEARKEKNKNKRDLTWPPNMGDVAPGPAYVAQTFSPTGYTQYFANLTAANIGDKNFTYEKEYSTDEAPYSMPDLLVSTWVSLARELSAEISPKSLDDSQNIISKKHSQRASKRSHETWLTYVHRAFVNSGFENSI